MPRRNRSTPKPSAAIPARGIEPAIIKHVGGRMTATRYGVPVNLPALDPALFDAVVSHGRWKGTTLRQRIEDKYIPEPMSGCWLWLGALNKNGYPQIQVAGWGALGAHRVVYQMEIGPLPDGQDACHRCDVRSCVNPSHIFPGAVGVNIRDMKDKGRAKGAVGARNSHAKISDSDVIKIRSAKGTLRQIGDKFGLSTSQVWAIQNSKSWSHVK